MNESDQIVDAPSTDEEVLPPAGVEKAIAADTHQQKIRTKCLSIITWTLSVSGVATVVLIATDAVLQISFPAFDSPILTTGITIAGSVVTTALGAVIGSSLDH